MKKIKKLSKNQKIVCLAFAVLVIVFAVLIASRLIGDNNSANPYQDPSTYTETQPSNYNSNEIKKNIVEDQKNESNNPSQSGTKAVTPLITYAGQEGTSIVVAAFVPGITEDRGTCTLIATQQQNKVTKSVTANRNTATTDCSAISIPVSEFPNSGEWQLIITYKSSTADGSSDKWTLNVK